MTILLVKRDRQANCGCLTATDFLLAITTNYINFVSQYRPPLPKSLTTRYQLHTPSIFSIMTSPTSITKRLGIGATIVVLYFVWFQSFYNLITHHTIFPYTDWKVFAKSGSLNLLMYAIYFLWNYLIVFNVNTWKENRKLNIWLRISVDTVLSFAVMVGVNYFYVLICTLTDPTSPPFVDWPATIMLNLNLLLIVEVIYYVATYRQSVKEVEKKQREALQYQYDALKAQVNPHFLFNSLNILYSLIDLDRDKSREFAMALSKTYRYIMSRQGQTCVPLAEEMKFLRSYTEVLKLRYDNTLFVEITGEDHVGDHQVITYCLQLLLENVIKHNIILPEKPMTVRIEVLDDCVRISNPVHQRIVADNGSGIGLSYISRMNTLKGKHFRYSQENGIFMAVLPFIK